MNGARSAPTAIWIVSFVICHSLWAGAVPGVGAAGTERTGRIIYLFRDALWSANPDGTGARPITKGMPVYAYDVAPDGERVAFAVGAWRGERKRREVVDSEVWVVNADGTGLHKIAGASMIHGASRRVGRLHWSLDGEFLAFDVLGERGAHRAGGLYVVRRRDGAVHGVARGPVQAFGWTPEGQIKYRQATPSDEGQDEWLVSPAGAPHPHPAPTRQAGARSGVPVPPAGGKEFAAAPPPLPPGAIPADQAPSPPPAPPAVTGPPPLGSSEPGAD